MGDQAHHAICPTCVRVVTKELREDAAETVETHNDARHGGDSVARVVGPAKEDLDEFMDYVDAEFDDEIYDDIGSHIVETDPWGVLA